MKKSEVRFALTKFRRKKYFSDSREISCNLFVLFEVRLKMGVWETNTRNEINQVDVRKTLTAVHCEATSERSELLPNFYSANGERYGKKILFLSLRRSDGWAMATKKSSIIVNCNKRFEKVKSHAIT